MTNGMATSEEQTTLDHIMCLEGSSCADPSKSYVSIIALTSNKLGAVTDLSDHYAVIAQLNYDED